MAVFKVGDIITGIKDKSPYGITNSNSVMKVTALLDPNSYDDNGLKVQIINTTLGKRFIGAEYNVKSKFFILYDYNIFKILAEKLGNKVNELKDCPFKEDLVNNSQFKTEPIEAMKEGWNLLTDK